MGRRGPPPTPTAKLARRGSWRAAERAAEPDALEALPPRPQLGEIATAVWDTYEPILREMRVLSRSDGMALELLARTYEEWKLAIQEIEKCAEIGWFEPSQMPAELTQVTRVNWEHYRARFLADK